MNRLDAFFDRPPKGGDGACLLGKSIASRSESFGETLRQRLKLLNQDAESFYANAKAGLGVDRQTAERWYNGKSVPRIEHRKWFSDNYQIDYAAGKTTILAPVHAPIGPAREPLQNELLAYALGSLQVAVNITDKEIVHGVEDSLKDPKQSPWIRIAVTLIRQAFQR